MGKDLQNRQIADFALNAKFEDIGEENIDQLKRHLLDSIGSLVHATTKPSIKKLARQMSMIGEGGKCRVPLLHFLPVDRAAQLYTALIRYPDFMDNFMGKEATCHPSDNIGSLLAAVQLTECSGRDFLTAMAVAYEIQCRLVLEIPVMKEGIDHTLLLSYSIVSSAARLLGMDREQTAHSLGIAGSSISPMVTSRASYTFEWKGFASSLDAFNCINIIMLGQQGMTGPVALFEGPRGFKEIFSMKLEYDWSKETFELIRKCVLKKYNAEVHGQSAIEAALELKHEHNIAAEDIEKIDVTTFMTCYHIIGSGSYGDRKVVETKEQADHSLFYLIAVALLDDDIYPEQFETERINRNDVQELLQKISVNTKFPLHKPKLVAGVLDPYTQAYPDKMKAKVEITMKNGQKHVCEKEDYHGFFTKPFSWDDVIMKFKRLCSGVIDERVQQQIIETVSDLENKSLDPLLDLICIGEQTYIFDDSVTGGEEY
jgi:2-methylcitrate dehydratase